MAFKFLEQWAAEREAEWMSHIRPEFIALRQRGNVTHEEFEGIRANSYEREHLYPVLTTDALIRVAEYFKSNSRPRERFPASTYDEALIHILLPLLIERLRGRENGGNEKQAGVASVAAPHHVGEDAGGNGHGVPPRQPEAAPGGGDPASADAAGAEDAGEACWDGCD